MSEKLKSLKKGDVVDIIAPSGKGDPSYLENIKKYVESIGLVPRISPDIYSGHDIFYANTNEYRAKAFRDALLSEDSAIVWAIRGGKGATEIIPYLEGKVEGFMPLPETISPKILIGFSDITALHLFLQHKYGFSTIHGAMLGQIVKGSISKTTEEDLLEILFDQKKETIYKIKELIDTSCEPTFPIKGELTGGNLTLVEKSLGTDWQVDTKDKIVFLEDVNGYAYQVERSLTHLIQANLFDDAQAIILCDFIKMENEELIPEVMSRFAKKIDKPVFHMVGIGHSSENQPLLYSQIYTIYSEADNLFLETSLV